ncbi:hypothetical protein LSM04_007634 [Trypanosoma melophagium]|uniref:uncharacterized protein n=1 Tax=Trypanosoma melophagium TaxID=715481 RepID=UPI00351A48C8|nr:hypothetical protein LSM04_007634 [Trypanosoma melophagium]
MIRNVSTGIKRTREDRNIPISSLKRRLRCPWCSDGLLLNPNDDVREINNTITEMDGNKEMEHLCTNKSSCRYNEVLQRDTTIAFSGIRKQELLKLFYAAFYAHRCCNARKTVCSAGSIVAEKSPLFVLSVESPECDAESPVFYFFVCDNCGVKEFVC